MPSTRAAAVLPVFGKYALLGPVGLLVSAATAFLVLSHLRPPTVEERTGAQTAASKRSRK
jgi:hypothetical protein